MISTPDRQTAVSLINEAVTAGARRAKACSELEISERTLRRWTAGGEVHPDQRPLVPRPKPANALSSAERLAVLDVCNWPCTHEGGQKRPHFHESSVVRLMRSIVATPTLKWRAIARMD